MILLHAGYDGSFFIWGECSFTRTDLRNLCRMRAIAGDTVVPHIWASNAEQMASALEAVGFSYRGAAGETREIGLPTVEGKYPVPAAPLLGEIPAHHAKQAAFGMKRWQVETLPLSAMDLLGLLPVIPGGGEITEHGVLLAHGVMVALDACYLVECCRFAVSLLERGHFLPDVRAAEMFRDERKYESIWRCLLIGEDAEHFGQLARVMPCVIRDIAGGGDAAPDDVLEEIFSGIADGLIRQAWSGKYKGGAEDAGEAKAPPKRPESPLAERKKRGRLVSALNPHALWARSLGWLGDAEGLSVSLESIYPDVRDWWSRFEWFAKAPFKLCVRLDDEPDANGEWRLSYALQCLMTGELIPAGDVWTASDPSGGSMRRYMLLLLGRVGGIIPAVRESLERFAPTECRLGFPGASDFLDYQAASLVGMGVHVAYPGWWRPRSIDRLTLRGCLLSGAVDPAIFAYTAWSCGGGGARGGLLSFDWALALDGALLGREEAALVRHGEYPLVNIRGKWVFLHRDQLDAICRHGESLARSMTAGEAIRLAVRDPYIDGFSNAPDLERVYAALREGRPRVVLSAPGKMKGTLRPYQLHGYSWMAFLTSLGFGACLADDMGLGKTVQTLALVQHHRDMGDPRPVLLVCPTSVLENWRVEIARFFPGLRAYLHHGRGRARGEDFRRDAAGAAMVLTSYALLQRDASFLQKMDWVGVVLDEAQNIKNPDTQQTRATRGLKAAWRVALTGTPIENHVGDLWSIMEFLMPGMLGSRRRFHSEYVKPIQESRDAALMTTLQRQVAPLIMRRMKTDREIVPDLPEKIESKVFCTLKKEQARMYSEITSGLGRELPGASGVRRKGIVLAALTRIKQICDHPALAAKDGDYAPARSAKLERMLSLAEEMFETGGKALIFTQYVGMGDILKSQLQERFGQEVLFLHGAVFRDARDGMVRRFQESGGPQFFILSLKAGGVGLNLTGANHVVMYDRWWNPAVETQAVDRAYRIGQTRSVHVHVFCCNGTVEERIDGMIESKKELASRVIDGYENWVTELSDQHLQRLLALDPVAVDA